MVPIACVLICAVATWSMPVWYTWLCLGITSGILYCGLVETLLGEYWRRRQMS